MLTFERPSAGREQQEACWGLTRMVFTQVCVYAHVKMHQARFVHFILYESFFHETVHYYK